jgi:hypothetical protein
MAIDMRTAVSALRALMDKHGRLTPDEVVERARNPKHPLHPYFEWDDKIGGALHRIEQARTLLAEVRYEVVEKHLTAAIQFVRDPAAAHHTQGYIATSALADDEAQARSAVINELDRVVACLRRARDVAEVVGVEVDVNDLLRRTEAVAMGLRKLRVAS